MTHSPEEHVKQRNLFKPVKVGTKLIGRFHVPTQHQQPS